MKPIGGRIMGIGAALTSALFLGFTPIFGKQAILLGFSPLVVVAVRTSLAAAILLLIMAVFRPTYLYIYPAGLLGCGLAGILNGIGSIFYYMALNRLTVSVGQLLYSLYPMFLVIWLLIDRQPPNKITYLRIGLAMLGVYLLTLTRSTQVDWTGVALMIAASVMYAIHLPINQRVLLDIPAPTVTLYTLLAMSAVVIPAYLLFDRSIPAADIPWWPVIGLTAVTFASRLTLFLGVKKIGGLQTALLGLSELLVSLVVSRLWLHEVLNGYQWTGAALLGLSLVLVSFDQIREARLTRGGLLGWVRPPKPQELTWGPHE